MEACCQDNASLEKRDRTHRRGTRSSYQRYFCSTRAYVHERGWLAFLGPPPLAARCVCRATPYTEQTLAVSVLAVPCRALPYHCVVVLLVSLLPLVHHPTHHHHHHDMHL